MNTIDCPKCEHEHEPSGSHEDDEGEFECEECGFKFIVEIEYDPDYLTSCIVHEWEDFKRMTIRNGDVVECRFCKHCQVCQLKD